MSNWKLAIFFFAYFVGPIWIGYTSAFPQRFGAGVTLFVCGLFLVCFLIGAAIKYWLVHG